tara:strand:- start:662 stop:946 length:285 start_codon:yes stop_codon:yes gene_type:complete
MTFSTRHIEKRQQQRGITDETILLADLYGTPKGNKVFLGKKEIQTALSEVNEALETALQQKRDLIRALDQGGVCLVEKGGHLVTTFHLNTRKRG